MWRSKGKARALQDHKPLFRPDIVNQSRTTTFSSLPPPPPSHLTQSPPTLVKMVPSTERARGNEYQPRFLTTFQRLINGKVRLSPSRLPNRNDHISHFVFFSFSISSNVSGNKYGTPPERPFPTLGCTTTTTNFLPLWPRHSIHHKRIRFYTLAISRFFSFYR
jgi:hypothetical protein